MNKVCGVCGIKKQIKDFAKQKNQPSFRCKQCLSEYNKRYYKKNQEKIKQQAKDFRDNNPEYMTIWRRNNIEKVKKQKLSWVQKNRININKKERHKRKINPAYKIKKNLRRRVNQVIKKQNKSKSTMDLIGCSIYELLKHIENQFTTGMTWDNYGKWHIDHIKPCASFDLTKKKQQEICFHYTNLQPLWEVDNIRKGDKILDIV
jgi:hypothetical protein